MHHRFLGGDGGRRHRLCLRTLIVGLFGDGLIRKQALPAREIGFGEGEIGARLRQIGAHLLEHNLERAAIDGEEQIALLYHLAILEMNLGKIA